MSAAIAPRPSSGANLSAWIDQNRLLAFALAVSVVLHGALLTIRFVAPEMLKLEAKDPGLEVVIVNTRSEKAPDKADVLAQVALEGGGDKDQGRASTPLPNAATVEMGDSLSEARRRLEELDAEQRKLLATLRSNKALHEPANDRKPVTDAPKDPQATDVIDAARMLARNAAIVEARIEDEYKRPKKHFYGTSAKDYVAALYIENFRNKVERWGNLNYPEAARGKLYGQVQITIVLDKDGTVYSAELSKSSGHKLLDQAALDIVRRAAPFGRFTDAMAKEMDLLSITRTMVFTNDALEARSGR
ncbi:MAG TPA: TonB family protein [Burkholderiaceae bacterium]|nr:TonB family protein [Burkholderiaceae bacterium]